MTYAQGRPCERLARRALAQHVIHADPAALVSETSLRRAGGAHTIIGTILNDAAGPVGPLRQALAALADDPTTAGAFRTGVRLLADLLESKRSCQAPLAQAVDEAEYWSNLRYHLGGLVEDQAADAEALSDQVARLATLTSPRLNSAKEQAELAVIVTIGGTEDPHRLRNCLAAVHALSRQCLERQRYRVVIVEQGAAPRAERVVSAFVDDYQFAPNPGPFNRSWAINMAVALVRDAPRLCLLDADALPDPHFLASGMDQMMAGESALLPFTEILHLDEASSARAVSQRLPPGTADSTGVVDERRLRGFSLWDVNGFCVWVTRDRYWAVGGHDERYRGWGDEDNEFHSQLANSGGVARFPERLLHLWHSRPPMTTDGFNRPNKHLRGTPRPDDEGTLGDPTRYLHEFEGSHSS
jgi:hypothetical protein